MKKHIQQQKERYIEIARLVRVAWGIYIRDTANQLIFYGILLPMILLPLSAIFVIGVITLIKDLF